MSRNAGNATSYQLTPLEVRAVHLWRRIGYGSLTLRIHAGEPVEATGAVQLRLDKPEPPGAVDLLATIPSTK